MAYRFLFLMDPFDSLMLETETSLLLMNELRRLGHEIHWIERDQIYLRGNQLFGACATLISTAPFELGEKNDVPLDDFDALINRKDPPFDLAYHHMTLLLDFLSPKVIQINSPRGLRDLNEKLSTMILDDIAPDTLVTADADRLIAFLREKGKVVVKPLEECSGRGILFLQDHESGLNERVRHLLEDQGFRYLIVQEYLPQIVKGDKRVFLSGSKVTGMVNRVPKDGESLGNIHKGAICESCKLSDKESATIARILPLLKEHGIFFAGVDFIGEKLTEINLTSPSALRQINQVDNKAWEKEIIQELIEFINNERNKHPQ